MAREASRVELKLSNQAWQVSAVLGAVEHFAHRAGFDDAACKDMAAAATEACRSAFRFLSGNDARLGVIVQGFADRVEVMLEHPGEMPPPAGLDTFVAPRSEPAPPSDPTGLILLALVDSVQYQTEGGISRLILTKYVPARL
jgi:anti-sigma regulatory factor (Ser/Thr protein kinase)